MKVKVVPILIAAAICVLAAFGLYSWCKDANDQVLLAVGSFVCLFVPLALCMGVRFEGRTTASTIAIGVVGFLAMLVSNVIFCFVEFGAPAYVMTNGIMLLVVFLLTYLVAQAKQ